MLRIGFHGAAGTVTGSRHLVMAGGEWALIDCGMYQGLKSLRMKNWEPPPFDPKRLPFVVLTHTHIDHSGMLPRLVREGFEGAIICTPPTLALAGLLLRDAAHIQEEDAEYLNRKGLTKHKPALPLFTTEDAEKALSLFVPRPYGEWTDLPETMRVRFHNAGHLLGSAMVEMQVRGKESGEPVTLLFSGDLGRYDMPLNLDPQPPPESDYLVLESTYGGRKHCADDLYTQVERIVKHTTGRGGVLLIPSFAVGRSQQIIYVLNVLMEEHRIPSLPIHLDSPMAVDATAIYRTFPDEHEARGELHARNVHMHRSVAQSIALNDFNGPGVIISSSGMLHAGRVLHHLKRLLPDPRNTVALIGYQAAGTRGRALIEGARSIRIHGRDVPVGAHVEDLCGFSGHADEDETMRWLSGWSSAPREVFLVHGEPESSAALASRIRSERGWKVRAPELGEIVTLS